MSAGPLHWFRKYQKSMLVVFGVLLMFVFTVGGVIDQWFSGRTGQNVTVRQVASTSFGTFTNKQLRDWYEAHQDTVDFTRRLADLAGSTQGANGEFLSKAKANPISAIQNSPLESRDRAILRRMALTKFAEDQGVFIGEETIDEYFNKLCNNELGNQGQTVEQFNKELQRYSLSMIKSHLKKELLANYAGRQLTSGFGGDQPTPIEVWEGHKRLKEKAEIEFMTLSVDDFLEKVSGEPDSEEMKKLYDEGVDRVPNFSSGPGFKTPRTVTVGYYAIDRNKYIADEEAKITEAQILTQYEEWVENEDSRVLESRPGAGLLPGNDGSFPPNDPEIGSDNKATEKAPDANTETSPPLEAPKNNADAAKNETAPAGEKTKSSGEIKPSEPKADPAKAKSTTDEPAKAAPATTDDAKTDNAKQEPKKSDQGSVNAGTDSFYYVSIQDEAKQKEPAKKDAAKQDAAKQDAVKQDAAKQDAVKQDAESKKQDEPPVTNDTKKADPPITDDLPTIEETATKPAIQDPASSGEKTPASNQAKPAPVSPLDVQKAIDEAKKRVDDKPIIKPLDDELRETIRKFLARDSIDAINKKIDTDLESVRRQVGDYLYDYEAHAENPDQYPAPKRPAFEKMAESLDLTFVEYESIGLDELGKTEFGKAPADSPELPRGFTTAQKIYVDFENGGSASVEDTIPNSKNVQFVYWVTDRKFAKKVSFAEAKPAIIKYYQRTEALKLAEAEAKKIANGVSAQNKLLSAEFGDKVKASEPFGWLAEDFRWRLMQSNPQMAQMVIQQLGRPSSPIELGKIQPKKVDANAEEAPEPLEGIGNNFMEKVFALGENEIGYAPNFEKDTVYIFQVIKKMEPTEVEKESIFTTDAFPVASTGGQVNQQIPKNDFSSELAEMYDIKWFGERESK